MQWSQIQKTPSQTLDGRPYNHPDIKEHVRQECGLRCVYCAVHENSLGGVQGFHVEHYRPKSRFPELERSLSNLYYACPICNRFKSDDWPAEPNTTHSVSSYPDPAAVDYTDLFQVSEADGLVEGNFVASKYIVEKLYFNRPQLILERRKHFLDSEMSILHQECKSLIGELKAIRSAESIDFLQRLATFLVDIDELRMKLDQTPAYELPDVTRPRS